MTPGNWITIAAVAMGYMVSAVALIIAMKSKIAVLDAEIKHLREEIRELRKILMQVLAGDHRLSDSESR